MSPTKRPQRNLFIIMSVMVVLYLLAIRLPPPITLWIGVFLSVAGVGLMLWARDFFVARYRQRQRRWQDAIERFEKFEAKLIKAQWGKLACILYLGIYTFDGVAITRNNIAQCFLNTRDLDAAEQWLRRALQRDPLYAIPYVNLAVVAALRGDAQRATREIGKAVQLGYSPVGAQRLLAKLLASINQGAGKLLD